jgi:hypothetical protein
MSTPETATTSNPAQEEYTLFAPGEGRKEKEGTMFMVIIFYIYLTVLQIRIRDPVPFRPLDPGSGKGFSGSLISDPGSQNHIFESLVTIFWVKSSIIL